MSHRNAAAHRRREAIKPHWLGKTLAGGVAGLGLSIALLGLFAWLGPDGIQPGDKVQVVMWLVPAVWMGIFSLSYLFRSGWHAWAWLGGANLLAYSALLTLQHTGGML